MQWLDLKRFDFFLAWRVSFYSRASNTCVHIQIHMKWRMTTNKSNTHPDASTATHPCKFSSVLPQAHVEKQLKQNTATSASLFWWFFYHLLLCFIVYCLVSHFQLLFLLFCIQLAICARSFCLSLLFSSLSLSLFCFCLYLHEFVASSFCICLFLFYYFVLLFCIQFIVVDISPYKNARIWVGSNAVKNIFKKLQRNFWRKPPARLVFIASNPNPTEQALVVVVARGVLRPWQTRHVH